MRNIYDHLDFHVFYSLNAFIIFQNSEFLSDYVASQYMRSSCCKSLKFRWQKPGVFLLVSTLHSLLFLLLISFVVVTNACFQGSSEKLCQNILLPTQFSWMIENSGLSLAHGSHSDIILSKRLLCFLHPCLGYSVAHFLTPWYCKFFLF